MYIRFGSIPKRENYTYVDECGICFPKGIEPNIVWGHIDGPLLCTSDLGLHWLTLWERIQMRFGWTTIADLDRKHRRFK